VISATSRRIDGSSPLDRRRARAWALQVHYRWESEGGGRSLSHVLDDTLVARRMAPQRVPFVRRLVEAMEENVLEVDARLEEALDNWTLARLASIDRGVLRVAATEMLFLPDVPPLVSIHEAIRIAEGYGGPKSPGFVNGVLDALHHAQVEGA
jgi:N utilization substance protein B